MNNRWAGKLLQLDCHSVSHTEVSQALLHNNGQNATDDNR